MIGLGLDDSAKNDAIARHCADHGIRKVFILSPEKFRFACSFEIHEHIEYADIIRYRFYYRLLQEIDKDVLVVVNECLRTQNRHDLTYNCIRNYLNQTSHQIIFQRLPIIDQWADFMTLVDWDTRSKWKREAFRPDMLEGLTVRVEPVPLRLRALQVPVDDKTRVAYQREKRKLIDGIGLKDPHTIPRNLYLMSGRAKLDYVDPAKRYVGRNDRFKLPNLTTFKEPAYPDAPYTVFEFCHNVIDFSDFLALSGQTEVRALVADLKVDRWYFERYQSWIRRIEDAYATIHGTIGRGSGPRQGVLPL